MIEEIVNKITDAVVDRIDAHGALIRWCPVKNGHPKGECVVLVDTPKGIDVAFYQDCTDFYAFRPMSVESENVDEPDFEVTRWAYLPRKRRKQ